MIAVVAVVAICLNAQPLDVSAKVLCDVWTPICTFTFAGSQQRFECRPARFGSTDARLGDLRLLTASPMQLCNTSDVTATLREFRMTAGTEGESQFALLAARGGCGFDRKAAVAVAVGASALLVADSAPPDQSNKAMQAKTIAASKRHAFLTKRGLGHAALLDMRGGVGGGAGNASWASPGTGIDDMPVVALSHGIATKLTSWLRHSPGTVAKIKDEVDGDALGAGMLGASAGAEPIVVSICYAQQWRLGMHTKLGRMYAKQAREMVDIATTAANPAKAKSKAKSTLPKRFGLAAAELRRAHALTLPVGEDRAILLSELAAVLQQALQHSGGTAAAFARGSPAAVDDPRSMRAKVEAEISEALESAVAGKHTNEGLRGTCTMKRALWLNRIGEHRGAYKSFRTALDLAAGARYVTAETEKISSVAEHHVALYKVFLDTEPLLHAIKLVGGDVGKSNDLDVQAAARYRESMFTKAIKLQPDNALFLLGLGNMHMHNAYDAAHSTYSAHNGQNLLEAQQAYDAAIKLFDATLVDTDQHVQGMHTAEKQKEIEEQKEGVQKVRQYVFELKGWAQNQARRNRRYDYNGHDEL